jgi:hypothetical protein
VLLLIGGCYWEEVRQERQLHQLNLHVANTILIKHAKAVQSYKKAG